MTCQMCNDAIEYKADSYRLLDGDTFESDSKGYVSICKKCARRVLLNHRGIPVVESLDIIVEVMNGNS